MTARDEILRFLVFDGEDEQAMYLGCTNGVIASNTTLNPNTIRRVLGQLVAEGMVQTTRIPSGAMVYRRV